mmetsp:Transcript_1520/g.3493  ORF Transcript_1520/g.3493 Transcript_1520/m.3493 type:complete len:226 (+) Transcript_1520:1230-1907(+)
MARTMMRVLALGFSCCYRAMQISRRQLPLASTSREKKTQTTHAFLTPSAIRDWNWSSVDIICSSYQTSSRMRISIWSRMKGPTWMLRSFHEWLKKIPGAAMKISRVFMLTVSRGSRSSTRTLRSQSLLARMRPSVMSAPILHTHAPSAPEKCTCTASDRPGKRQLATLSTHAQRLRSSPTDDAATTICVAPSAPFVSASWKNSWRSAVALISTLSMPLSSSVRRR